MDSALEVVFEDVLDFHLAFFAFEVEEEHALALDEESECEYTQEDCGWSNEDMRDSFGEEVYASEVAPVNAILVRDVCFGETDAWCLETPVGVEESAA